MTLFALLSGPAIGEEGPTWQLQAPAGAEIGARYGHTAVYDGATDKMGVFGGTTFCGFGTCSWRNDVWLLSNASGVGATPVWAELSVTGPSPESRGYHTAVSDAASNRMIVFGGSGGNPGSSFNDVWVLTHANGMSGTPAWQLLAPSGTPPAARSDHTAVYDAATNRLIVYGGFTSGVLDPDVWVLTGANGTGEAPAWVRLSAGGAVPPARYGHTAVYDPASNRLIVFGGSGFDDLWILTHANGTGGAPTWLAPAAGGAATPAQRSGSWYRHTAIYDEATQSMLVFGGKLTGGSTNELWRLSNATGVGAEPVWSALAAVDATPPARELHSAVYDRSTDRLVVFGGHFLPNNSLGDLWVLAGALPVPGNAAPVTAVTGPSTGTSVVQGAVVSFSATASDPDDSGPVLLLWISDRDGQIGTGATFSTRALSVGIHHITLVAFDGFGARTVQSITLTVTVDPALALPTWQLQAPAGAEIGARYGHTAVYDGATDKMGVFGGTTFCGFGTCSWRNDVWLLSNASGVGATPVWAELSVTGPSPESRGYHTAVSDAASNRMIVFGGSGGNPGSSFNDVWVLTHANGMSGTPAWQLLAPSGTPPAARSDHTAVYDAATNRLIVYGGFTSGVLDPDVWVLTGANGTGEAPAWVRLSAGGAVPPARYGHTAVYDPASNRLIVFGGSGFDDLWILTHANGTGGAPTWLAPAAGGAATPAQRSGSWYRHTAIYDEATQSMLVFGGKLTGGSTNELWRLSNATGVGAEPVWSALAAVDATPPARELHSAVYDRSTDRLVVFGGHFLPNNSLGDLWVLAGALPVPGNAAPVTAVTGPSTGTSVVQGAVVSFSATASDPDDSGPVLLLWISDRDGQIGTGATFSTRALSVGIHHITLVAFDGFGARTVQSITLTVTVDPALALPTWQLQAPAGAEIGARYGHTAVYDGATDKMGVFGGTTFCGFGTCSWRNDVWLLSNASGVGATPVWAELSVTGPSPESRGYHTAVSDAASNRMIVFGGSGGNPGSSFNDVWVLTHANGMSGTPAWQLLAPSGTPPAARSDHTAVYDAATNRLIVYGGFTSGVLDPDVWVLTGANGTGEAPAWVRLSAGGAVPPARYGHTAVYDPASNRLIVFGGSGFDDLWILTHANGTGGAPTWLAPAAGGAATPAQRSGSWYRHTAIYDEATQSMLVFGGKLTGGSTNELWRLSNATGVGAEPVWSALAAVDATPPARELHSAVYDRSTDRLVVFGGHFLPNNSLGDLWVLAGALPVPPVATPVLSFSPVSLSFESVVGSQASKRFTIKNLGTAELTGSCATFGPFEVVGGCSFRLSTTESAEFIIRFVAATVGTFNGSIDFLSNGGTAKLTITASVIDRTSFADLAIVKYTVSPTLATPGSSVELDLVVANVGGRTAPASLTNVRLSACGPPPSPADPLLLSFDTPALDARRKVTIRRTLAIPDIVPGRYCLWVILDATKTLEPTDESNDKARVEIAIIPPLRAADHLRVTALKLAPSRATAGTLAKVSFTVQNAGDTASAATSGSIRFSTSRSAATTAATVLARFDLPAIWPGASYQVSSLFLAPPVGPGSYKVTVLIDEDHRPDEVDITINSKSIPLTIVPSDTSKPCSTFTSKLFKRSQCRLLNLLRDPAYFDVSSDHISDSALLAYINANETSIEAQIGTVDYGRLVYEFVHHRTNRLTGSDYLKLLDDADSFVSYVDKLVTILELLSLDVPERLTTLNIAGEFLGVLSTIINGLKIYQRAKNVFTILETRMALWQYITDRLPHDDNSGKLSATEAWRDIFGSYGDLLLRASGNAEIPFERLADWLEMSFQAYRLVGYEDSDGVRRAMGRAISCAAAGSSEKPEFCGD